MIVYFQLKKLKEIWPRYAAEEKGYEFRKEHGDTRSKRIVRR